MVTVSIKKSGSTNHTPEADQGHRHSRHSERNTPGPALPKERNVHALVRRSEGDGLVRGARRGGQGQGHHRAARSEDPALGHHGRSGGPARHGRSPGLQEGGIRGHPLLERGVKGHVLQRRRGGHGPDLIPKRREELEAGVKIVAELNGKQVTAVEVEAIPPARAEVPLRSSHATPAARAPRPETKAERRNGHPLQRKPANGAHLPTRRRRKGQGRYQGHSRGRGQGRRRDAGGEAGRGRREGNPLQGHEGHDPAQGRRGGRHLAAGQGPGLLRDVVDHPVESRTGGGPAADLP